MINKLNNIINKYNELANELSKPEIISDLKLYKKLSQEYSGLKDKADAAQNYISKINEIKDLESIIEKEDDLDIQELANDELLELKNEINNLEESIKTLLIEADPDDQKNIIMEIRSGTGGIEAALFADDLFRMYLRYAENEGWKPELMNLNQNDGGGIKEAIFSLKGNQVFGSLKYESGVHRVQRVPETESSGRIHTSAATVAVLPEVEDVEVNIDEKDLRVDVFRASGPGGQSVNTTDSAVRITHIPTNIVVQQQDEKSQHKNKAKALKILRARIYDYEQNKLKKSQSEARKNQVGTGDRSERIRTYNFPQGRVTDHRINLTLHKLEQVLSGESLDEIIDKLLKEDKAIKLANLN